jgi:hypothetical protein
MCLLIVKPANAFIPLEVLKGGASANRDGAGIAIALKGKIEIHKSPTWGAAEIQDILATFPNAPAIVHFRLATHGAVDVDNAHPFALSRNVAAAHNGVISQSEMPKGSAPLPNESDTRHFLRSYVAPLTGKTFPSAAHLQAIGKRVGSWNKLAFLDNGGRLAIANESSGEWENGIWLSNGSWKGRSKPKADVSYGAELEWHKAECSICGQGFAPFAPFAIDVFGDPHCEACGMEAEDIAEPMRYGYASSLKSRGWILEEI